MAFPEPWLHELLGKNDIASVISEYTQLAPKGSRLWGKCPFHNERNPSLSVTPGKQLFHCFSCKAGGSVIQFIMQAENMEYGDAVRHLARRVGMDMPEEIDDSRLLAKKRLRERIYEANREAALFYHKLLMSPQGVEAQEYLKMRGVNQDTAVKFGLGYSPDNWDELYTALTKKGFSRDELLSAGLIVSNRKDETRAYDFFRGRLMFPIISVMGKVLAFGGRAFSDNEAKYVNTGDTPVYNKKENIYGINLIKNAKSDELIMVEGYMDVISLHQRGIGYAAASLGTALTTQQARLLKRFAKRVYYAYDGDDAGQKAMLRGVDILRSEGIEPRVIVIPGGMDPDDYVKRFGTDSFLVLKDSSLTGTQFKIERMGAAYGVDSADGREKFARAACALLAQLEPIERDRYIGLVSEISGLSLSTVKEQCGIAAPVTENSPVVIRYNSYKSPRLDSSREKCERTLLACLMQTAEIALQISQNAAFSVSLFSDAAMREFCIRLLEAYRNGHADIPLMLAALNGDNAAAPSAAYAVASDIANPIECSIDTIARLNRIEVEAKLRSITEKAGEATSADERARLMREYADVYAKLQQGAPGRN